MLLKTIVLIMTVLALQRQKYDFCVGTLVCVGTFAVQNVVSESVFQFHYKRVCISVIKSLVGSPVAKCYSIGI